MKTGRYELTFYYLENTGRKHFVTKTFASKKALIAYRQSECETDSRVSSINSFDTKLNKHI